MTMKIVSNVNGNEAPVSNRLFTSFGRKHRYGTSKVYLLWASQKKVLVIGLVTASGNLRPSRASSIEKNKLVLSELLEFLQHRDIARSRASRCPSSGSGE
jgi:hypothetical protein